MDLKRYLESTGETQAEFAKRSGISQSQVSRLMRKLYNPSFGTLQKLERAVERKPPPNGKAPQARDFRKIHQE